MSLPQAIRNMIDGAAGLSAERVNYGKRNEFGTLPAVAFEIEENETMSIGSNPLKRCVVRIHCVDETGEGAQTLAENVETALVAGVYNGIDLCSVINKNSILQPPDTSLGEETNPFVCITTSEIYYKE